MQIISWLPQNGAGCPVQMSHLSTTSVSKVLPRFAFSSIVKAAIIASLICLTRYFGGLGRTAWSFIVKASASKASHHMLQRVATRCLITYCESCHRRKVDLYAYLHPIWRSLLYSTFFLHCPKEGETAHTLICYINCTYTSMLFILYERCGRAIGIGVGIILSRKACSEQVGKWTHVLSCYTLSMDETGADITRKICHSHVCSS